MGGVQVGDTPREREREREFYIQKQALTTALVWTKIIITGVIS
jgi:hypothetical protein